MADFTYIWTAEGWLYAAAVMDLYSRRIVGWSMQDGMTSQLVVDALMIASAMESFFSSLKTEGTARKVYRSREQARADVFDYIERRSVSTEPAAAQTIEAFGGRYGMNLRMKRTLGA